MKKTFSILFLACAISASVNSQALVRGPYLQNPTSSSIVIHWRFDMPVDGRVYYGTDTTNLSFFKDDSIASTEHAITIPGLNPFAQYYYSIGTINRVIAGPSFKHRFKTSPVPGTVQPIRVWAIGDFGKGSLKQAAVRESYIKYTDTTDTDVWLWLGDNVYDSGKDDEYTQKVFDSIYGYQKIFSYMPFMPCPGNHDYESVCATPCNSNPMNHTGPYFNMVDVPKNGEGGGVPSNTELYYSFDYGNVHFISLNSELGSLNAAYDYTGAYSNNVTNSPMAQWLKQDLAATDKEWKIVYWHQCPYSKGSHNTDDFFELYIKAMRQNINPILEQNGVDLVITGHSHVFERSYLLKGHYGMSNTFNSSYVVNGTSGKMSLGEPYYKYRTGAEPNKGTVYVVCGNSGSSEASPALNHPAMYYGNGCDSCIGSFVIDINDNRLDGKYLLANGTIGDDFTIIKQDGTTTISENDYPFSDINIYPNPFKNSARIEYELAVKNFVVIELNDMGGKKIQTLFEGNLEKGKHSIEMKSDYIGLNKGLYTLHFNVGQKVCSKKIVKVE